MKLVLFLTASILYFFSCEQDESATPILSTDFGQVLTLRYQQSATLPGPVAPELTVTLEDINDSRCPADVTCVWAGLAKVQLGLRDQSGASQTLNLRIIGGPERLDSVGVQANGRQYTVVLRSVAPYPVISPTLSMDKQVVLTVKRR